MTGKQFLFPLSLLFVKSNAEQGDLTNLAAQKKCLLEGHTISCVHHESKSKNVKARKMVALKALSSPGPE